MSMETLALSPVAANGHAADHRHDLHALVDMLPDMIVFSTLRVLLVLLEFPLDAPMGEPLGAG